MALRFPWKTTESYGSDNGNQQNSIYERITMLNKAKTLKGYRLEALDGEIGKVREFYFDDHHWTIRYLVADTGNWLTGRQVLISPYALSAVNAESRHIGVNLTKNQMEDSPSLESNKPVSRQFEEEYASSYGWPCYWNGPLAWGAYGYPYGGSHAGMGVSRAADNSNPERDRELARAAAERESWDAHLRSTHDVTNHRIQAKDGEIGHVEDFIIDDETWAIRYLVVDMRNWWPGKKVLVSPRWIERVSWSESKVFINLSRETIKQSPAYTEESLPTRDDEDLLHRHYKRQGYWVDEPAAKTLSH
jgi:hypothetical protein